MSENYFDLTTSGVGFINRFRLNKPNQGNPYYSVAIAALRGNANTEGKYQKTYIDCNLVGKAIEMAKHIEPHFASDQSPSVMVKFVCGDLELKPFEYKSGERKGQCGFALKARLFDIKWFKVDNNIFYSEAESDDVETDVDANANIGVASDEDSPSTIEQAEQLGRVA